MIWLVGFMVFIATFVNISVMYRGGQLDHLTLYTSLWTGFELTTSVVIGTDCIGSCKFNYHAITSTTVPQTILPTTIVLSHVKFCPPGYFIKNNVQTITI